MTALSARQVDPKARPHPRHTGNPPRSRSSRAKIRRPSATRPYPRENPGKPLITKLRTQVRQTARTIARIKAPDPSGKQVLYWDTQMRGFAVLVSGRTNARAYVCQRDINGRTRRVTVGPVDDDVMTLPAARKAAGALLAQMYAGTDPKAAKKAAKDAAYSLRDALNDYLDLSKDLRARTREGYRFLVERHFYDWLDRPLRNITRPMVEERHKTIAENIAKEARNRLATGHSSANSAVRVLRILWNFASEGRDIEGLPSKNPARLHKNVWYPSKERTGHVNENELKNFYEAAMALENPIQRDCVLLMLFTGYRSSEAKTLRWDEIDFGDRIITIPAKRTKARRDHCIPMSDFVHDLLVARRTLGRAGPYVFPSHSVSGHVAELKFPMGLVSAAFGRHITAHDLRRTFITVAEQCPMSVYALKAISNHSGGGDITGRYVQIKPERLRDPVQAIADRLKEFCGLTGQDDENVMRLA